MYLLNVKNLGIFPLLNRYDMYGGESRVPSMAMVDPNGPVGEQGAAESGPALEVVQMANGETIW